MTEPRWHMYPGRLLLMLAQLFFFVLTLLLIIAAIGLNETMLLGILDNMEDVRINTTTEVLKALVAVHSVFKIITATCALFCLGLTLLLRAWQRKNRRIATIYAITQE